ncbi:MAG: hypothetical protein GY705_05370 [Bacteroidetes bacterium]|nr:hypothetical protein [Bacteroidota bacterium]MCP4122376.1 hypothetical protein [Bacteroidota bacterium]
MIRIPYLTFLLLLSFSLSYAQRTFQPKSIDFDNKGVVYDKEFTMDFRLLTNGFSVGGNIGTLKSYHLTRYYHFEIGHLKHPKEYRQSFDFPTSNTNRVSRSFIFGKQNTLLVLRAGFGEKRYFSEKAKEKGLAIGLSYEAGPSLGLLKPYYLELIRFSDTGANSHNIHSEKFSEENANVFLDVHSIYGSSGFSKGLGELTPMPGAHAKVAVHFDWGAFDEYVKAFEAGIAFDLFFKKAPIMAELPQLNNVENRPFFINLYLNLQLGKRW